MKKNLKQKSQIKKQTKPPTSRKSKIIDGNDSKEVLHARPDLLMVEDKMDEEIISEFDDEQISEKDSPTSSNRRIRNSTQIEEPIANVIRNQKEKLVEKSKKRAAKSSLIKDLCAEYSDLPEQICENPQFTSNRTRYEEENFTRILKSKKERNAEKGWHMKNELNSLLSFGDYLVTDKTENQRKSWNRSNKFKNKNSRANHQGKKKFKKYKSTNGKRKNRKGR